MNNTFSAKCSFCGFKQNVMGATFYCSQCKAFCNENGRLTIVVPEPSIENKLRYDLNILNDKCNRMYFDNTQLTNSLKQIQIDNKKLIGKINELTKKNKSKISTSDEKLVKENEELSKKINVLTKEINELKSKPVVKTVDLAKENNKILKKIDSLTDENNKLKLSIINNESDSIKKIQCLENNKSILEKKIIDLTKNSDKINNLNAELSLKLNEHKKMLKKENSANSNKIKKLKKKHETQLNKLEDNHLDTIQAVNNNNRETIDKFKKQCKILYENKKILENVNKNLKMNNDKLLDTVRFYAVHIETYLQRNIIGIDIDIKTLKEPFFSNIKRDMLIQYLSMVDIQYSRLKQLINTSSLMVCEVKINVFIRHFFESFNKVITNCDDESIKKGLTVFSPLYSLKRMFILSRFNFNNLMEIVTTCIPKEKLVKTRDLILSELISSKENAQLMCEILRLKKCKKSNKYFAYTRDVLNAMSGQDLSKIVDFEHDNLSSLCNDYMVDSLPVNINDVWYKIIQKYEKGLPGMKHNIVPIVKCEEILKKKMNI